MSKLNLNETVDPKYFEEFNLGPLKLKNRFILPPMCTFMSPTNLVTMDHIVHYTSLAKGGSSMVIVEATSVNATGLISDDDLVLYSAEHVKYMTKLANAIKNQGAVAAIQLSHAGRKTNMDGVTPSGVSDIKFKQDDKDIHVFTTEELDAIVLDFVKAAYLAKESGFEAIEIHAAHGYLLHQSLSPLTNNRTDKYGDKSLLLGSILKQIKANIDIPISVRISATEYVKEGYSVAEICDVLNQFTDYIDFVHVSSGGAIPEFEFVPYPGYQLDMATIVKLHTKKPVIAVGILQDVAMINYALASSKADAIAIGRANLENPFYINGLQKK